MEHDAGADAGAFAMHAGAGHGVAVPGPALAGADGRPLAPAPVAPVRVPDLPEYAVADRVRHECAATGLWFSGHPLDALPPGAAATATPAARLDDRIGRHASVV